jgi:hypothetical protein
VKRDLKDLSITKELALDRKEWKQAIHVLEPDLRFLLFYCLLMIVFLFIRPLSRFFNFLLHSPSFSVCYFNPLPPPPPFSPLFFFVFRLLWISSLAYPNLLGTKRLSCCCCICTQIVTRITHNVIDGIIWTNKIKKGHMYQITCSRHRTHHICKEITVTIDQFRRHASFRTVYNRIFPKLFNLKISINTHISTLIIKEWDND